MCIYALCYPINLLVTFRTSLQRRIQALLTACIHACVHRICYALCNTFVSHIRSYKTCRVVKIHHCQIVASPKSAARRIWKKKIYKTSLNLDYSGVYPNFRKIDARRLETYPCTKGRKKIVHLTAVPLSPLHFFFYSLPFFTLLK